MKRILPLAALASTLAVAACGTTTSDRAISGAGLGAGGGAAIGAIAGDPLTGALIGGAAGGLGGALTDPEDIDLGQPLWRR
jgi:osmotically inducible lipoprotein OsmB